MDDAASGAMEYCSSENSEDMVLPTPPPEAMVTPYSYELQDITAAQRDSALAEYEYIKGSSLEETPASSPGSSTSDGGVEEPLSKTVKEESSLDSVASTPELQLSVKCESSSDEEEQAPKNVKMPQSKSRVVSMHGSPAHPYPRAIISLLFILLSVCVSCSRHNKLCG